MKFTFTPPVRGLRPLAAAMLVAGFGAPCAGASLSVPTPAGWHPGDGRGVAALFAQLDAHAAARPAMLAHVAATLPVTSCGDNGGAGTLRAVIAAAGEGDTVDLSALTCSAITLAQGAIPVMPDDLTVAGPGAQALAIDGAGVDRVFVHYGYGTFTLQGLTVRHGVTRVSGYHVTGGACVLSNGYATLDRSTVSACLSAGEGAYGGGITARGVSLYTSTLSGNTALGSHPGTMSAAYGGGAMAYRGTAAIYDSTVSDNRAAFQSGDTHGSYDTGGGIFADRGGYARASTFFGNYSFGTGGGIAAHGAFFLAQCTMSGNIAKGKGGGAIFARLFYPMTIVNSTLAGNAAATGGGVYLTGVADMLSMYSSIVAGNHAAAGADMAAMIATSVAGANNMVLGTDAHVAVPADTLQADPRLAPLADYGGPTFTRALLPGSPAIGAGANPRGFAFDQRGAGFARETAGLTDIGAFQGVFVAPPGAPAPALSTWALAALVSLLAAIGLRRRKSDRGTRD